MLYSRNLVFALYGFIFPSKSHIPPALQITPPKSSQEGNLKDPSKKSPLWEEWQRSSRGGYLRMRSIGVVDEVDI